MFFNCLEENEEWLRGEISPNVLFCSKLNYIKFGSTSFPLSNHYVLRISFGISMKEFFQCNFWKVEESNFQKDYLVIPTKKFDKTYTCVHN